MKRVLLHICCGPCAIHPVRALREEGLEVVGLFHNPNIHPLTEYLRRRDSLARAALTMDLRIIYKDEDYDPRAYFRAVSHREANRCFHCYVMRLEKTRSIAKRGGFDYFSTTLLYSIFQKHEMIRDLGRDIAGGGATSFLYRDFRQGWKEGVDKSREWGLFRQQYCGCLYSENERYKKGLSEPPDPDAPSGQAKDSGDGEA